MAVTLTGGKYASRTISSAGTTTVTIGTSTFVSGDFSAQRVVALWDSTGATFKGIAYVRRYVSGTQVELEKEFIDPVDGSTATQAVNDIILVSKNWTDVATTGISVSNDRVDLTDRIVFGTSGDPDSLCFYDESKAITTNQQDAFELAGGVTVWGHLQDYDTSSVTGECTAYLTVALAGGKYYLKTSSTAAHAFFFGGTFSGANYVFVGGYLGSAPGSLVFLKTYSTNFISPGAGGNWGSNEDRCVLKNCFVETTFNGVLVRWGDGVISGGSYKIPNYASAPMAVFGTDVTGTRVISAPADERLIVSDIGNGNNYYRTGTAITITIDSTNVISTDKTCGYSSGTNLPANTNATLNFYYSDKYTNLVSGSVAVITLDADSSTVDSEASTGTTSELTVYHEQYTGSTKQFTRGPWTYGFKKYGYNPVSGAITAGTYDLGTPGTADNVSFGGPVVQVADSNVTLSEAAAAALTTTDDLDELYDVSISWAVTSVANAAYPDVGTYPVSPTGTTLDFSARDIVFDSAAGSVYAINTGTNTITAKPTSTVNQGAKFDTLKTTGSITGFTGTAKIQSATLDFDTATSYTGTYVDITADFSASGTFDLTGATISGTITLTDVGLPGAITVQLPTGTSYVNNGTNITVSITTPSLSVSVTGMPDAAGASNRLQIINTTAIAAASWAATTAYSAGDIILRTTGIGTESTAGLYMRCTSAGTSSASEPTWSTTVGGTTTDSGVTWTTFAVLFYDNDPGASLSTSYFEGDEFVEGEGFEYRFSEMDGATSFKSAGGTGLATASGISILVSSAGDSVYAENALDGSAQDAIYSPNYNADGETDYIVLDSNADFTNPKSFAYYCYLLTTSQGMYELWGAVDAIDAGNYRNNVTVAKIMFDETLGYCKQEDSDTSRWFNSDGSRPYLDPTTGGSGLAMNWKNPVYVTEVNTGTAVNKTTVKEALTEQGYTTARAPHLDNAGSLTFTKTGEVDANIQSVDGTTVTGAGTEADPWGP